MKHTMNRILHLAVVMVLALAAAVTVGCSSKDSPSAPNTGGTGGGTTPPSGNFTVQISANPSVVTADAGNVELSTVTVTVHNSSGGVPPNGSTVVVTISPATAGTLEAALCNAGVAGRYCLLLNNGVASAIFTPSGTFTGNAVLTAQLGTSSAQTTIFIQSAGTAPAFHIDHIQPNVGDPSGGQRVTIFGENFVGPVRVDFGGTTAQVISVASDRIVVVVPPVPGGVPVGQTLPVTVTVTNALGTEDEATDSLVNGFIYSNGGSVAQPQVFSVTPTTGPQTGNTPITINGSNFQSPVQVIFDMGNVDLEAAIEDVAGNRIVVRTPDITPYVESGALVTPVAATIRVVNLNSGFSATAGQQFFYGSTMRITSIAPGQGPFTGGTTVTIFGSGFDEPVSVTIGGIAQQVISVSGDQVVIHTVGPFTPPTCGGTSGPLSVVVTNIEGGGSASGATFFFIGPPLPVPLSITPTSGNIGAGFTIGGNNLPGTVSNTRVLFGGADGAVAPITAASTTSISGSVPTPPPGFTFNTEACDANGDNVASGTRNLPTPITIVVRNTTTGCEGTLTNAFTLNPPSATCTGDTSAPPPSTAQCGDGVDNDGDGFVDFPADLGCASAAGNNERTQCQDGVDNDGDTVFDAPAANAINPDPGCSSVQDTTEN